MPVDNCGNEISVAGSIRYDREIVLPAICADVDTVKQFVIPVIKISGANETTTYYTELGELITGTVTATDPCDCPCDECT